MLMITGFTGGATHGGSGESPSGGPKEAAKGSPGIPRGFEGARAKSRWEVSGECQGGPRVVPGAPWDGPRGIVGIPEAAFASQNGPPKNSTPDFHDRLFLLVLQQRERRNKSDMKIGQEIGHARKENRT